MQNHEQFEKVIKTALNENTRDILPSNGMFDRIKTNIETNRSDMNMFKGIFSTPRFSMRKAVLIGLCCTFLLTGTVFASSYISKYTKGFLTEKEYKNTPSKAEIKRDAGFEAKIPEQLPGGFKLDQAQLAGMIDGSAEVKKDDKRKVVSGLYKRPETTQKQYVTLSASNDENETPVAKDAKTINLNGTDIYYWEYTLHVVPSGYEPSEKEKAMEEAGNMVTVYVSSKSGNAREVTEESTTVKSIKWKDNGISYVLGDKGNELSRDELVKMAESIMKAK